MSIVLAPAPTSSITVPDNFRVLTDTSAGFGLDDTYSVVIVKQNSFWGSGKVDNKKFEYELSSPNEKGMHKLSGVLIEGLGFKRIGGDTPQIKFNLFARFTQHTGEERKICISSGATTPWTLGCLRGLIGLVENDSLLEPFFLTCSPGKKAGVCLCSVYQYAQPDILNVDQPELWMNSIAFNEGYHKVKTDPQALYSYVQDNARTVADYLLSKSNPVLDNDEFIEIAPISSEVA